MYCPTTRQKQCFLLEIFHFGQKDDQSDPKQHDFNLLKKTNTNIYWTPRFTHIHSPVKPKLKSDLGHQQSVLSLSAVAFSDVLLEVVFPLFLHHILCLEIKVIQCWVYLWKINSKLCSFLCSYLLRGLWGDRHHPMLPLLIVCRGFSMGSLAAVVLLKYMQSEKISSAQIKDS